MSGQQIGTVVGGVVGSFFGMPQLGMAIGGLIGGIIDPTKINGPHIGDGQTQTASDGSPIAWVIGTAWVAGCIVQVGTRREVKVKDSGKGGPEVSHYEAHQDFAILICESSETRGSTISQVLMIEQDGKIVYDVRSGSSIVADSQKYKANVDFMYGAEDQLPHPTLEAISGVGNTVAYRGSCVAVFKDFNLTSAGDRIPMFRFLVATKTTSNVSMLASHDAPTPAGHQMGDSGYGAGLINGVYDDYVIDTIANRDFRFGIISVTNTRCVVCIAPSDGSPNTLGFSDTNVLQWLNPPNVLFDTGWFVYDATYSSGVWSAAAWDRLGMTPPQRIKASSTPLYTESGAPGDPGIVLLKNVEIPLGVSKIRVFTFINNYSTNAFPPPRVSFNTSPADESSLIYIGSGSYYGALGAYYSSWASSAPPFFKPSSIPLGVIVASICDRGGLVSATVDVVGIAATSVYGYAVAKQMTAADALGPLLGAHFAYASEFDGMINFNFYGKDALITVDPNDLIEANDANDNAVTKTVRNQATEFPRKITVTYYDPAQNYMAVDATAERSAADVVAIGETKISMPVAIDGDSAVQAAQKALKIAYAKLEGTRDYCVPFARAAPYITVCAGEPVIMDGKRWVLDEVDLSTGYLKFSSRYDRQSAYRSKLQVIKGLPPTTPTSRYSGPTTLIPMNLPSLRPQDTYGLYLAAASATGSATWKGCTVQASFDGQQTWQVALTIVEGSTLGTVVDNEPSGGEPLIVDVGGTGDLASATSEQLAANANSFALVNGATAEIGQFETAEQDSNGDYFLTGVFRGLNGTTEVPAVAGQKFTMLDSVYFLPIDLSFKGKTIALRAVGFNEVAEDQPIITIVYNPDTTVIHDGGVVT